MPRLFRIEIDAVTRKQKTIYLDEELAPEVLGEKIRRSQEEESANQARLTQRAAEETRKRDREALIDKMLSERPDAPEWMKRNI
jgi:hypothetical protein